MLNLFSKTNRSAIRLTALALACLGASFAGTINPTTQYTSLSLYIGQDNNTPTLNNGGAGSVLSLIATNPTATSVGTYTNLGVTYTVWKLAFTFSPFTTVPDDNSGNQFHTGLYDFAVVGVGGPFLQVMSTIYNPKDLDNNGYIEFVQFKTGVLTLTSASNSVGSDINVDIEYNNGGNLYGVRSLTGGPAYSTANHILVNNQGNGDAVSDDFYFANATTFNSFAIYVATANTPDAPGVPEPSTYALMGLGLVGLAVRKFRK